MGIPAQLLVLRVKRLLPVGLVNKIVAVSRWSLRRRSRLPSKFCQSGLLFIHVPKVAGTSVRHYLFGSEPIEGWYHWRAQECKRMDPEGFARLNVFAIVRNPYDRLVSGYWHLSDYTGTVPHNLALRQYIRTYYPRFSEFVVKGLKDPAITRDVLFRSQSWFVCGDSGEILVDRVLRFEDLPSCLESYLQRPDAMPHSNKSRREESLADNFSDTTRKLVYQYYRDDFLNFEYSSALER